MKHEDTLEDALNELKRLLEKLAGFPHGPQIRVYSSAPSLLTCKDCVWWRRCLADCEESIVLNGVTIARQRGYCYLEPERHARYSTDMACRHFIRKDVDAFVGYSNMSRHEPGGST